MKTLKSTSERKRGKFLSLPFPIPLNFRVKKKLRKALIFKAYMQSPDVAKIY